MKRVLLPIIIVLLIAFVFSRVLFKPQKLYKDTVAPTRPIEKITPTPQTPKQNSEEIIKIFFNFINDGKISEAVSLLSDKTAGNEKSKKQWEANLGIIQNVNVLKIEPFEKPAWTDKNEQYKLILDINIKSESISPAIPNFGWENGENTRWIRLEKENKGIWKITEIATGP